jgi:hypothetical protein
MLLGKMAHDCLISVRIVPGCIGVGDAIKGVVVAGFDGVKPSLLHRKAQAGMIESNQSTNAGEVKAAWVKWGTCVVLEMRRGVSRQNCEWGISPLFCVGPNVFFWQG